MSGTPKLAALVLVACAAAGASGQSLIVGENLLFSPPRDFKVGYQKPETIAFRVIRGKDAMYSVQHAWRAVPSEQQIDDAMHALARVTVCHSRTPDHPCPSFDSLAPRN